MSIDNHRKTGNIESIRRIHRQRKVKMSKSAKTPNRFEDVSVWVIFSLCGIAAFTGLAIDHKEVTAIAFITLGALLAINVGLVVADNYRMKARIRKASKRTAADVS